MNSRNVMQSVSRIGYHVGSQLMKIEAVNRVDELYMKRAKFIMTSDTCEFIKQLALKENKNNYRESLKDLL